MALIVVVVHKSILTELCILNIHSFLRVSHSSIKQFKEKKNRDSWANQDLLRPKE